MSNEELGTLIRKYRHTHKLSQAEFACMFSVSQPSVGSWESGTSTPSGKKRDDIIKILTEKKESPNNNEAQLKEIIQHQSSLITFLKEKVIGLGGRV